MANLPTYTPADIPNLTSQISNLQTEADSYQHKLNTSSTALGGQGDPTNADVTDQESLQKIQKSIQGLQDSKLRAQWYPPATQNSSNAANGGGTASPGLIGSALDFIARPLYGVVGAAKHAFGQGQGSLMQDVADNMVRNKETFGNVLSRTGMPGAVSAPLGFALDVAMDPVNWATMGTSALIPRLGMGLYKGIETGEGALRGLGLAAKSSVLEKATAVSRFTPYLRKSDTFYNLGENAMNSTKEWEEFAGIKVADLVKQQGMGIGSYRIGLENTIRDFAKANPSVAGPIVDSLWYSSDDWIRQAQIKDMVQESLVKTINGESGIVNAGVKERLGGASLESLAPDIRSKTSEVVGEYPAGADFDHTSLDNNHLSPEETTAFMSKLPQPVAEEAAAIAPKVVNAVDDATTVLKNPNLTISSDVYENAVRVAQENAGDTSETGALIKKIAESGALNETGVKWFDNTMATARNFSVKIGQNENQILNVGKNVMGVYDKAMALFRTGKVSLSPTAYTFAVIGNLIMTHMLSGDIGPEFFKTLKLSWNFLRDDPKAVQQVEELLFSTAKNGGVRDPEMVDFFNSFKTAAKGTFGLDLMDKKTMLERTIRKGKDAGIISSKTDPSIIQGPLGEAVDVIEKALKRDPSKGGLSEARKVMATGGSQMDKGGGMLSNEMFNSTASADMFAFIEQKAKENPNHIGWKLLNLTYNKLPDQYEKIDQTYKLTTFLRAVTTGYALPQIKQIRHFIDIDSELMSSYANKEMGQVMYKLSPKNALQLANVMYMNYGAMPSAIKVLRNVPLLGSPFVSYMYAMSLKTGQTLAYNPSAFNKVTYAMNEFGGSKTPLEKKALDTNFYSYLKQPGMYRMPFFNENPLYLNMSNAIPYYSLNMFDQQQTSYGNSTREKIVQMAQSSPFMKDPVGATLFNYLIQPLILSKGIESQGQFGQPLYPQGANTLTKAGYATRDLAEAFVPGFLSYGGLAVPSSASGMLPLYRARAISEAKAGKNQLGISGKEPAASRTIREILKATGVPIQAPVDTTFSAKNKINNSSN